MRALILIALVMFTSLALAKENIDGHIRSSVYELETQLSRSIEDQISQFVGIENIWVSVRLDVANTKLKRQLDQVKDGKPSDLKYEELPGLTFSSEGNIVQQDPTEKKVVVDASKFSIDPVLLLSSTKSVAITVYNKTKIDKKVERLIRSLIEDQMSTLKVNVNVGFNYRKGKILETANLEEGKKIRLETKSLQKGMVMSFKEFVNDQVLAPFKISFVALLFIGLALFAATGYYLYRALRSINGSLGALLNAARNFEAQTSQSAASTVANEGSHDKTTTLQSDAVDLQQKILDIYTNYSEVVSSFFMNSMDKREFKDVWALTQVLGDKILLENKNICRNENFNSYNKFLRNSMHLVTSAEDFKQIYQKLMSLMLYPEVFFLNSIRNQVNALSLPFLQTAFPKFSEKEKLVVIEVLDDLKLATLVNKGLIKAEGLAKAETQPWEMEELKKVDKKLTALAQNGSTVSETPLLNIMRYFTQLQFNEFIQQHKLKDEYSFLKLFEARKDEAEQFLKGLSVEDLSAVLPMFEEDMVIKVHALLPELKLARVKAMPKTINERSFALMAELHGILWSEDFKQEVSKRSTKTLAGLRAA